MTMRGGGTAYNYEPPMPDAHQSRQERRRKTMLPLKKERKVTVTHTELGMGEFMVAIFTWRSDRYFLFSAILYDTYFLWSVFYLLWDVVFDNMSILSRNSFAQRFYFHL